MKLSDCLSRSKRMGALYYASPAWARTAETYVNSFAEFSGDLPMSEYGAQHFAEWAAHLDGLGDSRQTVKNKVGAVRGRLREAAEWGWLNALPSFPVIRGKAYVRQRILHDGEEDILIRVLLHHPPHGQKAAEITAALLDLGCRLGSLWGLKAHDVDQRSRTVLFRVVKNKIPYRVGMTRRAAAILAKWSGPPPLTKRTYQRVFNIAREGMGLAHDPEFIPHMLRHTCASRLMDAGVGLKQIQDHLGYTSLTTTINYIKMLTGRAVETADLLDNF